MGCLWTKQHHVDDISYHAISTDDNNKPKFSSIEGTWPINDFNNSQQLASYSNNEYVDNSPNYISSYYSQPVSPQPQYHSRYYYLTQVNEGLLHESPQHYTQPDLPYEYSYKYPIYTE